MPSSKNAKKEREPHQASSMNLKSFAKNPFLYVVLVLIFIILITTNEQPPEPPLIMGKPITPTIIVEQEQEPEITIKEIVQEGSYRKALFGPGMIPTIKLSPDHLILARGTETITIKNEVGRFQVLTMLYFEHTGSDAVTPTSKIKGYILGRDILKINPNEQRTYVLKHSSPTTVVKVACRWTCRSLITFHPAPT